MNAPTTTLATTIPGEHVRITMDEHTKPFWEAAKERRLVAPCCGQCGTFRLPPTPFCPNCQSTQVNWIELSGGATVYSFAVVHGFPGLPDLILVPVVVDVAPSDVVIGMNLRVDFAPIADGWLLPVFRPAQTAHGKE
jgi:uncharacterized protein